VTSPEEVCEDGCDEQLLDEESDASGAEAIGVSRYSRARDAVGRSLGKFSSGRCGPSVERKGSFGQDVEWRT
jgi:hypothetical protein